jgi:L-2-hydroxyglutarate oxidase
MRIIVVGGGIVGLATARRFLEAGNQVTVLEKEDSWATHQTGRNSGVIHAGPYYAPGSLKARLCVQGNASMVEYARRNDIPVEVCGKLIVATSQEELPRLAMIAERAAANGVPATTLDGDRAREIEPAVAAVRALHVHSTAIVDYPAVCRSLVGELERGGAELRLRTAAESASTSGNEVIVTTSSGDVVGDLVVNCAGLFSDRFARASGVDPQASIVPFRGEYFELTPEKAPVVRGLIYPVPDPALPFLGVHLTRGIEGGVHVGPNAVLALAREGYGWTSVSLRDLRDIATFPGFWRLARKNLRTGADEVLRSLSKQRFARAAARLVPGIEADDLVRAPSGVRAQAIRPDGSLVDDFLIRTGPRQVHVINAPSPAATASLAIAGHIAAVSADLLGVT